MSTTTTNGDREILQSSARSYLTGFVDNSYLNAQEGSELGYEERRWVEISELGWTGISLPGRVGGSDGTLADSGVILREVGRAALASPLLQTIRAGAIIDAVIDNGEADTELSRLAGGVPATVLCPADGMVRVERRSGSYVCQGGPVVIEWLVGVRDALIVLPEQEGRGWVIGVLDTESLSRNARPAESVDNERIAWLDVSDVTIPREAVLREGVSESRVRRALGRANVLRAAVMVGGAEAVLAMTARYALEREQFGRPIGSFQAVKHHLARMVIAVDAAVLTCEEALARIVQDPDDSAMAAVSLFAAGRSYVEVVLTAAQLHGGIGTTTEHILHHHFRRAKAMQLRGGRRADRLLAITDALICRGESDPW